MVLKYDDHRVTEHSFSLESGFTKLLFKLNIPLKVLDLYIVFLTYYKVDISFTSSIELMYKAKCSIFSGIHPTPALPTVCSPLGCILQRECLGCTCSCTPS